MPGASDNLCHERDLLRCGLRVLAASLLLAAAMAAETPASHIPTVHSTDLNGRPVDLPAMLQQRAAVLVVGFSRESRVQATAWGTRLFGDFGSSAQVEYFELAMLEDVPKFLRGLVLRSIAHDVAELGRPHIVPVTAEQQQWKAVTHFAAASDAYILVVDNTGAIRWQVSGELTDERYQAMRRALSAVIGKKD